MHVIGHNYKFAEFHIFCMVFYFIPQYKCNCTGRRILHPAIFNFTKKMYSVVGANGYKIGSIFAIIPGLQPGGFASVFSFIFL